MQSEPGKSAYLSLFSGTDLYVYLVSIHTSSPMKQNGNGKVYPLNKNYVFGIEFTF